ncbi:hypothetical protein [Methanosphaerula palustris]|uniref:hypothetical protein n=1 Tax=Methanosphaerula palustris TaxID=475088 RepID=UPI00064E2F65|nr:hypothetical protein [Methanosphaerula palustris]
MIADLTLENILSRCEWQGAGGRGHHNGHDDAGEGEQRDSGKNDNNPACHGGHLRDSGWRERI